jgi:hypothetical protein
MSRRKRKKEKFMVPQPEHRRQERSQVWKNLGQVQADSAKKQAVKQKRKLPIFALVGVGVLVFAICGGAYLTLSSGAQSGASVVRHVPGK